MRGHASSLKIAQCCYNYVCTHYAVPTVVVVCLLGVVQRRGFPTTGLGLISPVTKGIKVDLKKTRFPELPDSEMRMILRLLVLMQ